MNWKVKCLTVLGPLAMFVLLAHAQIQSAAGQHFAHKPTFITRLYTGPDGLTHAEKMEVKFDAKGVYKLGDGGAELHLVTDNSLATWHTGPRPQFVIAISGNGEVEVAGGEKIAVDPGNINLIEDTTGQGHISRSFGERVLLWIPITNQANK